MRTLVLAPCMGRRNKSGDDRMERLRPIVIAGLVPATHRKPTLIAVGIRVHDPTLQKIRIAAFHLSLAGPLRERRFVANHSSTKVGTSLPSSRHRLNRAR